jgi:hypothetical protein
MNKKEISKKREAILAQVEETEEEIKRIKGMKAGFKREAALSMLGYEMEVLRIESRELEKETKTN